MNLKEQQESTKGIIDNIIRELLRARRTAGLTQKELSSRTGIAQSDISKLERGIGNPLSENAGTSGGGNGSSAVPYIHAQES